MGSLYVNRSDYPATTEGTNQYRRDCAFYEQVKSTIETNKKIDEFLKGNSNFKTYYNSDYSDYDYSNHYYSDGICCTYDLKKVTGWEKWIKEYWNHFVKSKLAPRYEFKSMYYSCNNESISPSLELISKYAENAEELEFCRMQYKLNKLKIFAQKLYKIGIFFLCVAILLLFISCYFMIIDDTTDILVGLISHYALFYAILWLYGKYLDSVLNPIKEREVELEDYYIKMCENKQERIKQARKEKRKNGRK